MTKDPNQERPFIEALSAFHFMLPKPRGNTIPEGTYDIEEIKHLLHLLHILCRPLAIQTSPESSTKNSDKYENMKIPRVKDLREAGVKFKKVGEFDTDTPNLFNIKFRKGSMEIPCFTVDDSTDAFFRNLIAYEQHSLDVGTKYFSHFVSFMNHLIGSEDDVKLLCHKGIIMNCLGDDKNVSDLFHKLGDGLLISSRNWYYSDICHEVNEHRNKLRYRLMEKLRHDYFNNPWSAVSTIAAAVLLLFTLLQTIATLKAM